MQVVLIAPPIMDYREGTLRPIGMDAVRECPPYGVYLLASVLRAEGFPATVADLIAHGTDSIACARDEIEHAGLVGISATSMSWPTAVRVMHQVRAVTDAPIVLGGIHPTMFDEYVLRNFPCDFVIRGEGEVALRALCTALDTGSDLHDVPNLSWRDSDGRVRRSPIGRKLTSDELAAFPVADFATMPKDIYKGLSIESSRGCGFDCSFCSTSYRKTWRGVDPLLFCDRLDAVLKQADRACNTFVHVVDDEFAMNPRRAMAIARELRRRNRRYELVYDARANDLLFEGFLEELEDVTHSFLVGAECGYDDGLAKIGKGTTTEKLEAAAARLYAMDMADRADFSFILGLPWEDRRHVERTVEFAGHLSSAYGVVILLQWYCQIPGSRLWDDARARGLVTPAMYDDFGFFRNLYLFSSAVRLTPDDIWEVSDRIEEMMEIAQLRCIEPSRRHLEGEKRIEYRVPEPIAQFFPREPNQDAQGLVSLRQVAGRVEQGRPLRRISRKRTTA